MSGSVMCCQGIRKQERENIKQEPRTNENCMRKQYQKRTADNRKQKLEIRKQNPEIRNQKKNAEFVVLRIRNQTTELRNQTLENIKKRRICCVAHRVVFGSQASAYQGKRAVMRGDNSQQMEGVAQKQKTNGGEEGRNIFCIYLDCKIYLSKLLNIFVQIAQYICSNS